MNDSVALHDGNVGLDNLQLRTTAMTNNRQNNMVVKKKYSEWSGSSRCDKVRGKKKNQIKKEVEEENKEKKRQK